MLTVFFVLCFSFSIGFQLPFARKLGDSGSRMTLDMKIPFVKYQGIGNDFILVNNGDTGELCISSEEGKKYCNRHYGVGADGLIFVCPGTNGCDYTMRMYNADGTEPEMCGNGIRCMARFIHEVVEMQPKETEKRYKIHTLAGEIVPVVKSDGRIVVDMGIPILESKEVPTTLEPTEQLEEGHAAVNSPVMAAGHMYHATAVSMGNPHCIIFVDDLDAMKPNAFDTIGPIMESHETFPEKVNVEFVQKLSDNHLKMYVWERGAGPTLACGTGACATVVAGVLTGNCDLDTTVALPGGDLDIRWDREGSGKIFMTGPAEQTFRGEFL